MTSLQENVFAFAHDVGSPIMIALNLTELLRRDDSLTPSQHADLERVHGAVTSIYQRVKALREAASGTAAAPQGE